jgi:tetratricopeptide (TPR) repeat protein
MSNPNKDSGNPLDFGLENLDVQDTIGKTTAFFQANKSKIILSGIILLVLAGTSYGVFGVFLPNRQEEAQNMMYMAERYFENDSLTLAINGDGNFPGFLEIESDYSWTDAGRLARYYLGVSYLRQGEYDEAIRWLEKFSSDDVLLASVAKGATADAYLEKGDKEKAAELYLKAAGDYQNEFTSPIYLSRAAELTESLGNLKKALELYERLQKEYPSSPEGSGVEKYIARLKARGV